jgi:hypothetical protein
VKEQTMSIMKAIKRYLWDGPLSILPVAGPGSESAADKYRVVAAQMHAEKQAAIERDARAVSDVMAWAGPGMPIKLMGRTVTVVGVRPIERFRSMHPGFESRTWEPAMVVAYFNEAGDLKTADLPIPLALALRKTDIDRGAYTPPDADEGSGEQKTAAATPAPLVADPPAICACPINLTAQEPAAECATDASPAPSEWPAKGKARPWPPEARAKLSASMKAMYASREKGGKADKAWRKAQSEASKKKWMDADYRKRVLEGMAKAAQDKAG